MAAGDRGSFKFMVLNDSRFGGPEIKRIDVPTNFRVRDFFIRCTLEDYTLSLSMRVLRQSLVGSRKLAL